MYANKNKCVIKHKFNQRCHYYDIFSKICSHENTKPTSRILVIMHRLF